MVCTSVSTRSQTNAQRGDLRDTASLGGAPPWLKGPVEGQWRADEARSPRSEGSWPEEDAMTEILLVRGANLTFLGRHEPNI